MNAKNTTLYLEALLILGDADVSPEVYNSFKESFKDIIEAIEYNWGSDFIIINSVFSIQFLLSYPRLRGANIGWYCSQ